MSVMKELNRDSYALEDLAFLISSCETYGITQDAVNYAQRSGLLSGTGLGCVSTESLASAEDLSGALEDMKEALTNRVKGFLSKSMSMVSGIGEKISNAFKKACSFIAEKAKAAGGAIKESVKTHPYAWVAGAVAAIAAIGVAIGVAAGAIDLKAFKEGDGAVSKMLEKIKSAFNSIKLPGGKSPDVKVEGTKITFGEKLSTSAPEPGSVEAKAGGWTAQKAKAIGESLSGAASKVMSGIKSFGRSVHDFGMGLVSGGLVAAGDVAASTGTAAGSKVNSSLQKAALKTFDRANTITYKGNRLSVSPSGSSFVGAVVGAMAVLVGVIVLVRKFIQYAIQLIVTGISKAIHAIFGSRGHEESEEY